MVGNNATNVSNGARFDQRKKLLAVVIPGNVDASFGGAGVGSYSKLPRRIDDDKAASPCGQSLCRCFVTPPVVVSLASSRLMATVGLSVDTPVNIAYESWCLLRDADTFPLPKHEMRTWKCSIQISETLGESALKSSTFLLKRYQFSNLCFTLQNS